MSGTTRAEEGSLVGVGAGETDSLVALIKQLNVLGFSLPEMRATKIEMKDPE